MFFAGGLIALAAVAIGLGGEIYTMITEIVLPVLKCFSDQDSRVRYYACESMYNVAKVIYTCVNRRIDIS